MKNNRRILFLADSPNCLSLMAECIAETRHHPGLQIFSANMKPAGIHPILDRVMREAGLAMNQKTSLTLLDIEPFMFDLIITLGDFDPACRPNLPGMPPHFHWDLPDPGPHIQTNDIYDLLTSARKLLKQKIDILFDSALLDALSTSRRNLELVLDNLMEGVMAHTTSRRIFYFNKAAETITGYRREDILGKDCHEVFPWRLCGGGCEFCESSRLVGKENITKREVIFFRPEGKERSLRMSVMPLVETDGREVGALVSFEDETELNLLKRRLKHHHAIGELVGKDPRTLELFDYVREVSAVVAPVWIEGESGVGKELVAHAIHSTGPRSLKPFVAINCGALPEGILESELFGHVKGAFTGAVQNRKGRFEMADGGTLFLDEVDELSPAMQVKLLRVLQEHKFERVGGEDSIRVDVRVISATNQNLRQLMNRKKIRRDLFYRLCVIPITVPPLRERKLDIPLLVDHFLELIARELNRTALIPSNEVIDAFNRYPWPGNVRQLRNVLEYVYVKCRETIIRIEHLPPEITAYENEKANRPGPPLKFKKEDVLKALARAEGNKQEAARMLGIGRATLYRYLETFGLK